MELELNQSRSHQSGHTSTDKFDGETIRQMGIAFEMAVASLRATPDCNHPIRAALAQRIIALAKAGEHDPERLCEGPCGRSAHPDGQAVRRAAKPPKPDVRSLNTTSSVSRCTAGAQRQR
jgi:hypothetical protein